MLNTEEKRIFAQSARAGVCSHLYIIDGEDGVGKTEFALWCAKALLCTSEDKPCGICTACRKCDSGHPDIFVIGNGEKAATMADVRELIRRSNLKPNDADRQVFIIANAGRLRTDAQNTLLKLIEEPPGSVTVLMLTESRSSLLPTVLSRGRKIHLSGLSDDELMTELTDRYPGRTKKELADAVLRACGNIRVAESRLDRSTGNAVSKAETVFGYALEGDRHALATELLLPRFKRDQLLLILDELLLLATDALLGKYGREDRSVSATKKQLSKIGEAVIECRKSVEANANLTSACTRLLTDFCAASAR